MNSYERCMAAIKFKPMDKMPVDLHNFQMCVKYSGMKFGEHLKDGKAMAESQYELYKKFGHDMLLVENGSAALAESMGCEVIYRDNDAPVANKRNYDSVDDLMDDLGKIGLDNFLESPLTAASLEATKILNDKIGNSVFVMGRGDQGPFSLAALIYGIDKFLMDLMDDSKEEKILKLLDLCADVCSRYCIAMIKIGVPCTSMGDSTAGPDMISPEMYEKFAMPFEKKVVDAVHKEGGLIALHICGNATKIIDRMIMTGADIIEIDEKTDLRIAVVATKGKCALLGQVSPAILKDGSKEEVIDKTNECIDVAGGNGATGFILGPGCTMAGNTPYENVMALINERE